MPDDRTPRDRTRSETAACARLLDGAADELATIRAAIVSVSLEASDAKRAASRVPAAQPLRTRPVQHAAPSMPAGAPRETLAERLRGALRR